MTPKPEDAPPEWYTTAWRRLWAGLIDGFVLEPLILLNGWIWSAFHNLCRPLVCLLCHVLHRLSVLLHWRWGQTLGKRATGIRVHSFLGGPLSLRQAAMRDIFPLIASIIGIRRSRRRGPRQEPLDPSAGFAGFRYISPGDVRVYVGVVETPGETMLINSKRRAVHDFIAGTVVMRVSQPHCNKGRRWPPNLTRAREVGIARGAPVRSTIRRYTTLA